MSSICHHVHDVSIVSLLYICFSFSQESISAASDELSSQKSKFQKRINEIREELEREKSLRHSLEESHNTLLARIREMESIVESERKEVCIYQPLL